MRTEAKGGNYLCQAPNVQAVTRTARAHSAGRSAGSPMLSAAQAAREVYGVSERTFHDMRRRGLVPLPIALGPRLLRWMRADLIEAAAQLPRQQSAPEPSQLTRGKATKSQAAGQVQ